jgi:amino acid adenylation domain-containing protein
MSDLGTSTGKSAPPRFSAVLGRLREKRAAVAPGIGRRSPDRRDIPLSFAQQRLWFMEQLEPGTPIYNIPVAMTLTGRLDVTALARSLGESVRRHEALRTTFRTSEGQPLQVIGPPGPVEMPLVDLGGASLAERDSGGDSGGEIRRLMLADARRTFDLENGPLLRATLLRLGPARHVLLVSLHHLVGDAWSVAVLLQELIAVYTAIVEGRTEGRTEGTAAVLPELPLQYPDFALWQREWLQGEVLERYLSVWRERLAGSPAVLHLPTDRPRPARRSDEGKRVPLRFSAALVHRLEGVARGAGTTLFTLALAAFQVALYRWSGEDDLMVGTPVANRRRSELQGLVGLFVNMLAMRADLRGRPTLRAFLKRTHERVLEAQDHQELPFEKLVEELQPTRTASHMPLFQVILAFQNVPMPRVALPGCAVETQSVDPGTSMFDLSLNLEDRGDGLVGWWEYSTALFDAPTLMRLDARFHLLMEGLDRGLDLPLDELPFLTGPERHQAEREWNDTAVPRPPQLLLHRLVAAQVERTPDAEAVVDETERITYRELARRADLLARRLRALGVGPDVPVGVFAERSIEMVVALLGILEAGGAYVPLDPVYPAERLAFMAREARMPVILTQSSLLASVPHAGAAVVLVEGEPEETGAPGRAPRVDQTGENLAYVIFTSGSTGRPKGAMLPHAGVCNRLLWGQETCGLGPGDRVLQKTPFSFDVSVWELFWPLLAGATLVMARPGGHQDPAYLAAVIEAEAITTLHFVPSMLQAFLAQEDIGPCSSLRRVMLSGEALPEDLRRRFYERLPDVAMHNLYGPTEASVEVTFWPCPRENERGLVPIGRPISNTRAYVVDTAFHPVPAGAPGELLIGGVSLARGYLGRPDLTGERFVPDPFAPRPGGRLYRTGDLARHLPDGTIEYLGRIDNQVKLRGFRIEPGEIEARLREHPGIADAVVAVQGPVPDGQRLVAFLVPRGETLPPDSALRAFLNERLPDFMTPAVFLQLAQMPLTPSGKVDRRALPQAAPGTGEAAGEAAGAPPRTPVEEILCEIWSDVLGVRPGIHDNFFALGGHSLLAPRITAKVRLALATDMPLRSLFDHPTVAQLAAALQEERWPRQGAEPPLVPARREGPLPLSFPQLRFWSRRSGGGVSNIPLGISLTGALDLPALHGSLAEIVRRHDSLRAGFADGPEGPVQTIRPAARLELPVVDLSSLPEKSRETEARRLAVAEGRHRFDFERDLLMRALLVRLAAREHALLLVKCHLVTDGWSETVLIDELGVLYEAFARRAPSPLAELPIQYGDFALWQREVLRGPAFDELLGYWVRCLDGGKFPVLPLPLDFPRPAAPAVVDARAGRSRRTLPAELSEGLRQLGRREGASLFMTLLTAFDAFLARWTGHTDIALTTNTANRGRAEIERLIGLFTNVLALRADLSGDPTFRAALARVRASTLEAYAHQELPFVELLERFHPGGPEAYNELFPAGFVLQGFRSRFPAFPGLEARPINLASGLAPRDFILVVTDRETEMEALLLYRANLFRPDTVDGLLAAFEAILAAVVEDPDLRLSALPWPSPRPACPVPSPKSPW